MEDKLCVFHMYLIHYSRSECSNTRTSNNTFSIRSTLEEKNVADMKDFEEEVEADLDNIR